MPLKRNLAVSLLAFTAFLLLAGCAGKEPATDAATSKTLSVSQSDSLTIEINGRDGASVLELTLESHVVESYESAMGTFVRAIDSIAAGGGYWWLFTVNDSTVNTASDKFITKDNDIVRWHFRKP